MQESQIPEAVPPDTRLSHLLKLAEQVRSYLLKRERTAPTALLEQLSQLTHGLKDLIANQPPAVHASDNLVALAGISQIINSTLHLNEVLRIAMDMIVRLTNAERGFLMLREPDGRLAIRVARNWSQESIDPADFAISRTVVSRVLEQGQPVLTTDAQEDPRFLGHQSVMAYQLRSILCVPLKLKNQIIGVIYADNRVHSGIFTESARDLLTAFANQTAVAIENARLFESVRAALAEATELKELMDNVFESIASGVITTDDKNRITMSNRAAQEITGQPAEWMRDRAIDEVFPSFGEALTQHIQTVWKTQANIIGVELEANLPGRPTATLSLNLSPLNSADHTPQGVTIVLDDLTEKRRLQSQRRLFERMVSPAVIDQIDPDQLSIGGRRSRITTLFADIRGFTQFSEGQDPVELVSVLNRYLAVAAQAVLTHRGTIDKFLGDAVMAWFNAPVPQHDHALHAVMAALEMQAAVSRLHKSLPGEQQLSVAVGIHYGEAVLGLVGIEERLDYTAIGDSVNTAKRIQEHAASGQILISARVLEQIGSAVHVQAVTPIQPKGKSQSIEVYEVLGLV